MCIHQTLVDAAVHLPVEVIAGSQHQSYDEFVVENKKREDSVFPALLKYWRQQRGMSQLDLGLTADVSARHISFLESGRSKPSVEMVALLAETLAVPLRDRNDLLRGAGFKASFPEPSVSELLDGPLGVALNTMLEHHEPYPMMVFDRHYNVVRVNNGGAAMFLLLAGVEDAVGVNLMKVFFQQAPREVILNWEEAAGEILRRIQREVMHRPNDEELASLLAELLENDGVPEGWRTPDLLASSNPMVAVKAKIDAETELNFLATITSLNAPSNVTLDELRIESYLPMDEATRDFFE